MHLEDATAGGAQLRYGFIGLGSLGRHLAANLTRAGFDVTVYDQRRPSADAVLALGAQWAPSVAALAELHDGSTWIEMSTNDFTEIEALATRARRVGVATLACPVTGGVHRAEAGDITILAGGAREICDLHEAALRAMGGQVIYVGGIEQASVTKVVTNMLAFIHLIAAGEALMLCAKGGVDLRAAFEAIAASSGNSFLHEDLACKDAGFAVEFGRRFGVPLRLAGVMEQIFIEGRARYGGGAFSSMIVKLLEDAMQTPLRAAGFPGRLGDERQLA